MSTKASCEEINSSPFLTDVVNGLSQTPKTLPTKFFYDKLGSELFEQICELPEYYLTRTELAIMEAHATDMGASIGPHHVVLELGSGASLKTRKLLSEIDRPAAYVPLDISPTALESAAEMLRTEFPKIHITPLCCDFMKEIRLPKLDVEYHGVVTYFPGSTIGNLNHTNAVALLKRIRHVDQESDLLIGIDLEKDRGVLLDAYNDRSGVTAAFNKNLLTRINRELDGDFDVDQFQHRAIYNEEAHRIEMHLVSLTDQSVTIGQSTFDFSENESICTEHSHKYTIPRFESLVSEAGFKIAKSWTDPQNLFAVILLTPDNR